MADAATTATPAATPEVSLEAGTYEILRHRLGGYGKELCARLARLNEARKQVFGSIETALIATDRITTLHNCIPRDMVAVGRKFLFGYNVHFGLKSETSPADVLALYEYRDGTFHPLPLDFLADDRFHKDFHDLYRYYKQAAFAKFHVGWPHLYMLFQVGKTPADIKAFKWHVSEGGLTYLDNRSEHEVRLPPQHDFEWKRTHRDQHRSGPHPHVSIEDRVFVETIGGDLTIKIENNTASGEGIYREPVDDPDQTLDDAEIYYALLGHLVLLKIRPYQESRYRHFVYNEKTRHAVRLDAIEHACVLLPDDHGLIFPNGYYLQSGENKTFEHGLSGLLFLRRIAAPNGEDYLYVFCNRESGLHVLLEYNVIEQRVGTPLICHGFTFFEDGRFICFKAHEQPQKHHAVQIWQTPYVGEEYIPHANTDSYLYKIGNRDMVRCMAECHEVLALIQKEDTYAGLYVDLAKAAGDILDAYFWIDKPETFDLAEVLRHIRDAANSAVDEFEKVVRVQRHTAAETGRVAQHAEDVFRDVKHKRFEQIGDFVASLAELRQVRGEVIALRDLRYADAAFIAERERRIVEETERLARRCVEFLLRPDALRPYERRVEAEHSAIGGLEKVADARKVDQQIARSAAELEMLIEIVSNLQIDDATQRTAIIDNISALFSRVNQARAALKTRTQKLLSVEGAAEFGSQMKLLNQAVVNYLDVCDTPDKCDEYLTKVMIQIEELEGRFAEFDEFVPQLAEKREQVYAAFETRKLQLIEARNKRAQALLSAADRILKGIRTRVESLKAVEEIHSYFAADLMIAKVRDIVRELGELGDSVKVDDVQSRLKTIREDAVRQLKDRQELFVRGENVIRLGRHLFNVNVQPLDLTTVLRDGQMYYHLTGTNFFEKVDDPRLEAARDLWEQELVSENREVYRGEYLAYLLLRGTPENPHREPGPGARLPALQLEELTAQVTQFMGPRYSEGYVKGVHDHDAARILQALLEMQQTIGLLRYPARARALAAVFWRHFADQDRRLLIGAKLKGIGAAARLFPGCAIQTEYVAELRGLLAEFLERRRLFDPALLEAAAEYLFCELTSPAEGFAVSRAADRIFSDFHRHLERGRFSEEFAESLNSVQSDPASAFGLCRDWVRAFLTERGGGEELEYVDETAALLLRGELDPQRVIVADVVREVQGLLGTHPVIRDGKYRLDFNSFTVKLNRFQREVVPRFNELHQLKRHLIEQARQRLKLDEFRPRVLTSFVRNKLIDDVYLPLVGDNLAKQIGTAGEGKRTDRMGLLLLVSPPGYGKTTLMEYIAHRLGIIFVKINGPALGQQVTSLDPAAAPNAAAREEIEKLNLSLEMGDNVMIYVDDIQHTHPEFLQKFISLCDATRKIEGVYQGRTRTYDLRGRKVAVVMAGNPYTESGEKFQIPDMLSNRADIYNLGEIIGENVDAFEMSFLENCLTSNPVLSQLAARSQKDVYAVIKLAQADVRDGVDFEGNYSVEELDEFVAVMRKLLRVRDVVLRVNREYIRSAAMADEYRTEPAFKLQGSYRNMNRIAEKVLPVMNDDELLSLIVSSYENDAQTLTKDAEANLLKFKELLGILTDTEARRWDDIKKTFQRNNRLRGIDQQDKVGQVVAQLSAFSEALDGIRDAMTAGVARLTEQDGRAAAELHAAELAGGLHGLQEGLARIQAALAEGMARMAEPRAATAVSSAPSAPPAPDAELVRQLVEQLRGLEPARQEITVVNKIPPSLLRVLQQQFKLMHGWLKPILETASAQTAEIHELKQRVEACLDGYAHLLDGLEQARRRSQPKG